MYNDRRLARTRSCPTLFAVLKEQMVQGKKIRLSRGTLNYIKSKKAGKFYKSTSSSELETILEGDEGESCTDDDTLSNSSVSSSHSEPCGMNDGLVAPVGPVISTLEQRIPNGLRISPRRLSQWSDSVVVQRYVPQGQTSRVVEKERSTSYAERHAPQCYSNVSSNVDPSFMKKEINPSKDEKTLEKQDSVLEKSQFETGGGTYKSKSSVDLIHPGQLWLPPIEWRVENTESLVWNNQHVFHKEEGGWWMERWTLYTESGHRLGDKFGVDADGTPWSEWWMEKELSNVKSESSSNYVKKFGQKWGRNAKGERWYETWQVKNDGKVETTYRLERAKSGNFRSLLNEG